LVQRAGGHQHYGITFAVLAASGVSYALLSSLVVPAIPNLQHVLHTSANSAAWLLTAFLLTASIATPIVGRLGDMFGKHRLLVIVLVIMALGCLLAAVSKSLTVMVIARAVQGIGGGVFPLAFGIIRDEFPRERVAGTLGLISAMLGVGGGVGIVLAGVIIQHLSYHWLYWIPLVVIALSAIAAQVWVPESPLRVPGRVNFLGAALFSGSLVCLLVGVSETSVWGWLDVRFFALLVAAAALGVAWVVAELRSSEPLVDMRMMRIRGVWTTNVAAALIGFGMYASFILIPEFVELPRRAGIGFGSSVTGGGLFLVPTTVAMLVMSILAGRLAGRIGSKLAVLWGAAAAAACFVILAAAHHHQWEVYVASGLLGIGIGLAFAALANLIVEAVPPSQTGVATGMNTLMRTVGGAIGAQIGASVIAGQLNHATGLPTNHGFTLAFVIIAAGGAISVLACFMIPGRRSVAGSPAREAAPVADLSSG
jgi:EmrB/QacA subfamily drug resistance transporter